MPLTFLAHQAPVLPLKMRRPQRWDGLALVLGTLAPDLAYATGGWGYGPLGIPLWFDGHAVQNVVLVGAIVALITMLSRRWVFPVAPLALPDTRLHLRDLTAIGSTSHRWWVTFASAVVGVLTHIVIDGFTHAHGFAVEALPVLSTPMFTVGTRQVAPYSVLQYGLSLVLAIAAAAMLWRIGRERMLRSWSDDDSAEPGALTPVGRGLVLGFSGVGLVVGTMIGVSRTGSNDFSGVQIELSWVIGLMTTSWYVMAGVLLGSVAARPFLATDHQPRSIHESS